MKATWSLFKKQGFKTSCIKILQDLFISLGVFYTILQVLERMTNKSVPTIFILYMILILLIAVIIITFLKTHARLTKTYFLRDGYKITIKVDDYLANVNTYSEASCVTGINNQFDLTNYNKKSLLYQFIEDFYEWENEDPYSDARLTLEESFDYKIKYHDKFKLMLNSEYEAKVLNMEALLMNPL